MKKIIVIDGLIGVGKTTLVEILKQKYKDIVFAKEPVEEFMKYKHYNPLKLAYENPKNWTITQLHIINCLVNHFKKIIESSESRIIVSERGVLSPKIFTRILKNNGFITDFEHQFINDYNEQEIKKIFDDNYPIDGIFYIDIPPEIALKRIRKRGRDGEDKINLQYLKDLDESFKLTLSEYEYKFPIKIVNYDDPYISDRFKEFYDKFHNSG